MIFHYANINKKTDIHDVKRIKEKNSFNQSVTYGKKYEIKATVILYFFI